jgi:aconitate hydratase
MASLARTILEDHLERGELVPGQEIGLRVDQTLAQDATGTMAMMQFESFGVDRVQVETAVVYVDHNILQIDFKNPDDHRFLQAMAGRYGAWFSRPGNGICHYVHCERFAAPGKTLVGADSHTTQSGSCGMIAIGAGGLDVAVCMAGHPFELPCPKIVGVFLENELQRPWIQAKDVILELLRRRGVRGGRGAIFEFTGPGVAGLTYTERGTIANMIAELGATGAVFPADDETRDWMSEQGRDDEFLELATGDTGDFDEEEHIDLAELVPLVAKPSSPGNVVPVEELVGTEISQVCIGSSVNSSYADLALCGAVMRGSQISENLVSATATPGSRQILDQITRSGTYVDLLMAGVRMLEPACGPCVGMGQAPPSGSNSLRTFNRNFPGRSGTADDQVYLCSPAVAAASMLTGAISDPRELADVKVAERPEARPQVVQAHILEPVPADEASSIEIPRGLTRWRDGDGVPLERAGDRRVHLPAQGSRVRQAGTRVGRRLHRGRPQLRPGLESRARRARARTAWRPRGDRQELRAHPPAEPDRPGHPAAALPGRERLRQGRARPDLADLAAALDRRGQRRARSGNRWRRLDNPHARPPASRARDRRRRWADPLPPRAAACAGAGIGVSR